MASEVPPASSPGAVATKGVPSTPTDATDAKEETSTVRADSKAFALPGTPVLTVYGTGVILRHRADGELAGRLADPCIYVCGVGSEVRPY